MAILTFRSATDAGSNTGTVNNLNVTLPTGTASGDLQTIWVGVGVAAPGTPPNVGTPSGWTLAGTSGTVGLIGGTFNVIFKLFYKIADGSDGTVNLANDGGTNSTFSVLRKSYQNPDLVTPFAQVSFGNGGPDTSPVVTGVTTGANAALIDIAIQQGAAATCTPPGSMTERIDNATYGYSSAEEIIPTAGATGTRTFTLPGSADYLWGIAEFRSANVVLDGTGGSLTLTGGEGGLFASGISGVFYDGEFFQGGFFGTPAAGGVALDGTGTQLTLTGGTATLRKDRILVGAGTQLTLSGGTATLRKDFRLTATGGALTAAGGTATLRADRILVGTGAALTLTGGDASLTVGGDKTLVGDPTALTLAGGTASLAATRILVGAGGAIALTGGAAQLRADRILLGSGAALALTGGDATLSAGGNVSLDGTGAALTLTGGEATFERSGSAVVSGPTPAGGVSRGGRRKRKVLIGDRLYEVDNLRDIEFLLKRVVREEAPVVATPKPRKRVVDRVSEAVEAEAPVALEIPSIAVDWSPLYRQLAAQDAAYADLLAKVLEKQEEDDLESILLLL